MCWRKEKRSSGSDAGADVRNEDGPEEAPADTEEKGGDRGLLEFRRPVVRMDGRAVHGTWMLIEVNRGQDMCALSSRAAGISGP